MTEQSHNQPSQTKKFSIAISHNTSHTKESQIRKEGTTEEVLHTRVVSE